MAEKRIEQQNWRYKVLDFFAAFSSGRILALLGGMIVPLTVLIFFAEQGVPGSGFDNLRHAVYWMVVTATTTGYGDITPKTRVGPSLPLTMPLYGSENEDVLVRLNPGAYFGEMAFIFGNEQRSATVSARNDVLLLEIKSADFDKFVQDFPNDGVSILRNIAKIVSKRLRKANHDVAKLTTVLSVVLSRVERTK